ncbi:MAG: hypothetical protein EBS53_03815, partial [Bacteroidetes bacterium]|nr:hypothetical protein [Bacteroidota bacterium]
MPKSPGSVVTVPITVTNFNNIGAVSLDLNYSATALTYTGFNSAALTGNLIVNNPSTGGVPQGRVLISWFSLTSANIGNGLMMNLTFTANASTAVNWNLAVAGQCELADGDGEVINNVAFNNGSVTVGGASITTQPAGALSLNAGASGSLSVVASGATGYQWQVSTGGGSFTNLSNGGGYSGVTTSTLGIVASTAMNGNQYRVRVSGAGCPAVVSSSSHLTVILPPAVNIGQVNGCRGQLVAVPLQVQDFNDISAVTLNIRYDTAALTYVGYSNTALTGNLIVNAPGQGGLVIVSWYSLTPVNISNGLLMNLNFITRGSSAITFDLSDPAYNELASSSGDPIANTSFTNGGITASGAVITGQPAAS